MPASKSAGQTPWLQQDEQMAMVKTNEFPCSLSFLASCHDLGFLEHTIRHIVRVCRYPFVERLLSIDIESGSDEALLKLRQLSQKLVADSVIDRVVEFDRTVGQDPHLAACYFGCSKMRQTRDHRNIPLYGWISGINACTSQYLLHFDCDILLYQHPKYKLDQTKASSLLGKRAP